MPLAWGFVLFWPAHPNLTMRIRYLLVPVLMAFLACNGTNEPNPSTGNTTPTSTTTGNNTMAPSGEEDWRAADTVFAVLGGVQGKVVADLAAGDGYYTERLLRAGARVIAMEEDPALLAALQAKKAEWGLGDDRLQVRAVSAGQTGLQPGEVDIALLTKPYATVAQRANYVAQVRQGTRAPHVFAVVDFLQEQTPVGPPMDERTSADQVMDELGAWGFQDVLSLSKKLHYRYIVVAQDLPPDAM